MLCDRHEGDLIIKVVTVPAVLAHVRWPTPDDLIELRVCKGCGTVFIRVDELQELTARESAKILAGRERFDPEAGVVKGIVTSDNVTKPHVK